MLANASRNATVGYSLMAASTIIWIAIAILPFTSLGAGTATVIGGVLLFVGEGLFAAGVAIVGPQLWMRIKTFFRGTARIQVPATESGHFPRAR